MDQVFTALDRRQAMLLLTTVAFGGQESLPGFQHLRPDEGALLRHRAEQLLQIPREKRIPLLIHELKRRMSVQRSQLLSADPQALAALLASERQSIAEVVLRTLPATLADQVRALLPPITVKLAREVRPDVINAIRWKLEARLGQLAQHLPLRFVDVLLLEPRDHYGLCDRLGARALAAAVEGLGSDEKATFLGGVTPDQRLLLEASMDAVRARALSPEDAATMLALHQREGDPSDAVRSAGAQRLARACIAQSPELAARLLEKHRGTFGQAFMHWVREERGRARPGDGGRTEVLAEMESMVLEGVAERPVRAPPRKVQTSTPPPSRSVVETPEVRPPGPGREGRTSSLSAMPVRRPSRISPAVKESRADAAEPARGALVSPPRLLTSERAVSMPSVGVPEGAPSRVSAAAESPGGPARRSPTLDGSEPRSSSGELRARTGELRAPVARPPPGAPRTRPSGGPNERPSREERPGASERPSREERLGGAAERPANVGSVVERPSREERVGGAAERPANVGSVVERPSREERMGAAADRPPRDLRTGSGERPTGDGRPGAVIERPSREERMGAGPERPSRDPRAGGVAERPSREERMGAGPERPSRDPRAGGVAERPSREERMGAGPERPSREPRAGGGGVAERPSREERMGAGPDRPSREPRAGGGGVAERPSREERMGGVAERPSREERMGGIAERPSREERMGGVAERPSREERMGGVAERPSREERMGGIAERPSREERVGGPERASRPPRAGGPEPLGAAAVRAVRDPAASNARPGVARPEAAASSREAPRLGQGADRNRPPRSDRPATSRASAPPDRVRPVPPGAEGTASRIARIPGAAAPSVGGLPPTEQDPRGRLPRDPSARPPRGGESTADLRARVPSGGPVGARPERAPAGRGTPSAPSRREPAAERGARPAGAAAPVRKAEGARGEGRGPRSAQVPSRPSRKLE